MPQPRSPRKVRRVSFKERASTAPFDSWMLLQESIAAIDWEGIFTKLSYAIVVVLNAGYIAVKYHQNGDIMLERDSAEPWDPSLVQLAEFLIWAICGLNTVYMFTRSRSYLLFKQPTKPNPYNPQDRTWMITSPNAELVSVDLTGAVREDDANGGKGRVKRWFAFIWRSWRKVPEQQPPIVRQVWRLKVWNPSPGSQHLFCWFSPVQVAIMHNINSENWKYFVIMAAICAIITWSLVNFYQNVIRDREILSGQLLSEFSQAMYQLENFPPPRKFDIITHGLEGRASVLNAGAVDEMGVIEQTEFESEEARARKEYHAGQELAEQWVESTTSHSKAWSDPNAPDPDEGQDSNTGNNGITTTTTTTVDTTYMFAHRTAPLPRPPGTPVNGNGHWPLGLERGTGENDENKAPQRVFAERLTSPVVTAPVDRLSPDKSFVNVFQSPASARRRR
ncbi:uncharacterized protein EV422DRAFT_530940 [Fimicolochytrium jonesii]|uniref:uncharacterized protein n=1 Tax=Fimicolochytrium jonesii TaxID=1396493 RepID=UPI0022FE0038|nr:uncharacterized protein EV422DRAFT_530940 [Fimicolochytrium jonesii]KAI8820457.1 hypothetical protein EV422DRAFT_530940 [Fimicolochytrium jonesii]